MKYGVLRRVFQILVLAAAVTEGMAFSLGASMSGIEKYCPFGGLESAYSLLTSSRFTCAAGEANLSLLVALLVGTLIVRKAFCSWICPVGALSEAMAWVGGQLRRRVTGRENAERLLGFWRPRRLPDHRLRWLRLPALVAVLGLTAWFGEFVFRAVDPYYILFSVHGHDVVWWSYLFIAAFAVGSILVSMAWCRYLCPLGGALVPFSACGALCIARKDTACVQCKQCDVSCPHGLDVSGGAWVKSAECTLCLACADACVSKGALQVAPRFGRRGWSKLGWAVPVFVVGLTATGIAGAQWIAIPSYTKQWIAQAPPSAQEIRLIVDGLRCVDTARAVAQQLRDLDGVVEFVGYASRRMAVVTYDPTRTTQTRIREAIEAPVYDPVSGQFFFHRFKVKTAVPADSQSDG
jgi:polyferredoxin